MSVLKQRGLRGRVVGLIVPLVVLLAALAVLVAPLSKARTRAAQLTSIAYAVGANARHNGLLLAFDARTGTVLKRIDEPSPWQSPDLLVSPAGDRLYLLYASYATRATALSVVDTRSWATLASASLPDALLYTVTGPSALLLTPDGSRLLVYSYDGLRGGNAYWLALVDPVSLRVSPTRIPLPGCGGAQFALAHGQVVALCFESNDVRFIDPQAARVNATVPLPAVAPYRPEGRAVGLAVSPDQGTVYVVSNDLRIMAISATTHTLLREVTAWRRQPQTVPSLDAVAISPDGRQLIVGVLAQPRDTASAYALRVFTLPDPRLARTIPLPRFTHFVAAPLGGLYTFQVGDEPAGARHGQVRLMSPDLAQTTTLGQFDGPLYHVVSPVALAVDERAGHVFVANQVDGTVSVLDARNGRVIRTVPVGTAPVAIAVDARTGRAFVVNSNVFPTGTISGPSSVSVLDTHTGALVRTVAVGQRAYTLAIDERANRVFVVNGDSDSVNVLDARTGQALHTIPVGLGPRSIAADAGAGRIFVANYGSSTVSMLDAASGQVIRTVPVGTPNQSPNSLLVDAHSNRVFVGTGGDSGAGPVIVVDARTGTVRAAAQGTAEIPLVVDTRDSTVFTFNPRTPTIIMRDARTGAALRVINGSVAAPTVDVRHSAAIDERTGHIFLARLDGTIQGVRFI